MTKLTAEELRIQQMQEKHNLRMRKRQKNGKLAVSFFTKQHRASLRRMHNEMNDKEK